MKDRFRHVEDLIRKAEEIIGISKAIDYPVAGNPFVTFGISFRDFEKAKREWLDWISVYKQFARFAKPQAEYCLFGNEPLCLYWKLYPEIVEDDRGGGLLKITARLLISVKPPGRKL